MFGVIDPEVRARVYSLIRISDAFWLPVMIELALAFGAPVL